MRHLESGAQAESGTESAWGWGRRNRLLNETVSVWEDEDILKMNGCGRLHNSVDILNPTELETLKWLNWQDFCVFYPSFKIEIWRGNKRYRGWKGKF